MTWTQSRPLDAAFFHRRRTSAASSISPSRTASTTTRRSTTRRSPCCLSLASEGVSPFLTRAATSGFNKLLPLSGGTFDEPVVDYACAIGVTHVVVWSDIYGRPTLPASAQPALTALRASPRFSAIDSRDGVYLFGVRC